MPKCEIAKGRYCVTMRLALAEDSPIKEVVPGLLGWEQRLSLGPDFPSPSFCPWCGVKIIQRATVRT